MPDQGERIATLEAVVAEMRRDADTMSAQLERTRGRLHDLEGFAQAYLDVQKANRRAEDRQYRKVANAIALGGLIMAAALVALTIVTILIHTG